MEEKLYQYFGEEISFKGLSLVNLNNWKQFNLKQLVF